MPDEVFTAISIEDELRKLATHELQPADDTGERIAHLVDQLSSQFNHAPPGRFPGEHEPQPERWIATEQLRPQEYGNAAPIRMAELRLAELRPCERRNARPQQIAQGQPDQLVGSFPDQIAQCPRPAQDDRFTRERIRYERSPPQRLGKAEALDQAWIGPFPLLHGQVAHQRHTMAKKLTGVVTEDDGMTRARSRGG